MQLFSFDYAGQKFIIDSTPSTAEERVFVDGALVSRKDNSGITREHLFDLEPHGNCKLVYAWDTRSTEVSYQLWVNAGCVLESSATISDEYQKYLAATAAGGDEPVVPAATAKTGSWLAIGLIAFKLVKTAQVIKVALLAASVAVYSVMFTLEFAFALIAVLVFHEYGHLRAMKKFGLPTKGMYLIPFVGGLAVGDMPKTRWQDVYISMMGPVFGLVMTAIFYLAYLATGSHFAGLVASTSALLNVFNLIPVHPLDGGRVIKSLVFSGRNYFALVALLVISAVCFVLAWKIGFYFITFFIVLGVIDIVSSWRLGLAEDILPLTAYGIVFCLLWYFVVVALFLGMILLIALDKLPGSEIALKVLSS